MTAAEAPAVEVSNALDGALTMPDLFALVLICVLLLGGVMACDLVISREDGEVRNLRRRDAGLSVRLRSRTALRAGLSDREQTIVWLKHHFADGRLTIADYEARVGAALAAVTCGQLADLLDDLPDLEEV